MCHCERFIFCFNDFIFFRQGMQQILDSVREQDGKSDVKIQSEALEQIMTVLDARHCWGNYHPAMTLKSRIEKLEGMNTGKDNFKAILKAVYPFQSAIFLLLPFVHSSMLI